MYREHEQIFISRNGDYLQPVSQVTRQVLRARPMRKRRTNRYNSVNYFKRTVQLNDIVLDNTNPYFSALNFSLADVPAVAEFQNLYDWYKITGVRIRAIPLVQVDSNSTSSVNNANNHPIFYTVDTSDSTVPTAITDIMQYNDCKIAYMFKGFTIYFKPKYTDTASAMAGGWVNTTSSNTD